MVSFGGIPFLFLGTNQIIFIIIILLYIFSGMAFASLSSETSLGVKVTEGNGKLPKVVLSFVDGRDAYFFRQHGFARNMNWSIADSKSVEGNPIITLELKYDPYKCFYVGLHFKALYKGQYLSTTSIYYPMWLLNLYSHPTKLRSHFFLYSF
ncbi:hypothetical protein IFM89_037435 [Coptis chinensis]|uniref:Uncharacterized protein n=1 Tax=Coptis chinensis TaxID=261450 RepID=A0A835LGX4_9MAGN|nr:hypothetical protein IFM89_037435 [Coptis chinensis]